MRFVKDSDNKSDIIEIGDLLKEESTGRLFLLVYQSQVALNGRIGSPDDNFLIIDLENGIVGDSFSTIDDLSNHYSLVTKHNYLSIHY